MKINYSIVFCFLLCYFGSFNFLFAQTLTADAGPDQTICYPQSVQIGGNPILSGGTPPYNFIWYPQTGLSVNTFPNPLAMPISTMTYCVYITDGTGATASDCVTVTVNPHPNINAGNDQTICPGSPTMLNAIGGISYLWSPSVGLSDSGICNPTALPSVTTVYTVTATDTNGCTGSDILVINVNPLPTAFNVTGGGNFCSGGSGIAVGLSGSQTAIFYQLLVNGLSSGSNIPGTGGSLNFGNQYTTGNYTVYGIDTIGCLSYMTGSASIIAFNPISGFLLIPDSITPHHYFAVNNSTGTQPLNYLWSWGDGTVDSIPYPSHIYSTAGNYMICLTITDSLGCTDSYCDSSYLQKSAKSIISVDVIPQGSIGINANETFDLFKIYPSPASNNITVGTPQNSTLKIINIQGQLIKTIKTTDSKTNIDVSAFPSGLYIVKVETDKGVVVRKFVKE
jgi:hypothetical protein